MTVIEWLLNSDPWIRRQVMREGAPSRWNTLRVLRVLDWFAQGG